MDADLNAALADAIIHVSVHDTVCAHICEQVLLSVRELQLSDDEFRAETQSLSASEFVEKLPMQDIGNIFFEKVAPRNAAARRVDAGGVRRTLNELRKNGRFVVDLFICESLLRSQGPEKLIGKMTVNALYGIVCSKLSYHRGKNDTSPSVEHASEDRIISSPFYIKNNNNENMFGIPMFIVKAFDTAEAEIADYWCMD